MEARELDYEFDPEQVAQFPLPRRDCSQLMVADRKARRVGDAECRQLPGLLEPGDLLVLNDAKVFPARLLGRRASGGVVELLLTEKTGAKGNEWLCLQGGGKRVRVGETVDFGGGLVGCWGPRVEDGRRLVSFRARGDVWEAICEIGHMPLPPYIRRPPVAADRERYQTVYARSVGAVAAPTAGLHFTTSLLNQLSDRGVRICYLTLNVGAGTFSPIRTEELGLHRMWPESYCIPPDTAEAIRHTRRNGGRVVAVGTTTTRALEGAALASGEVGPGKGETNIFIMPGYRFRVVDSLVTNFHLPRSTPLALVMALAGAELSRVAYRHAVQEGYRLYSYGDAMLIR